MCYAGRTKDANKIRIHLFIYFPHIKQFNVFFFLSLVRRSVEMQKRKAILSRALFMFKNMNHSL